MIASFFYTPSQLCRQIREGGPVGAYYSIGHAIWEDDASIKSGSLAQLIHKNVPGRNQTDHHGSGTSEVGCGRVTLLCLTRYLPVHWLKLSRGSTMETRVSYGITAQGSAQNAERLR